MLRDAGSGYVSGRTDVLLKVKTMQDAEAEVLKHLCGTGKNSSKVGALLCRDLATGLEFRVGSGLRDHQRSSPPAVGLRVTYGFFGKTKLGHPRFPVFLRERPLE